MTIISGVVGGVDSVAKEIKINKLEKQIEDIKKGEIKWNLIGPDFGKQLIERYVAEMSS